MATKSILKKKKPEEAKWNLDNLEIIPIQFYTSVLPGTMNTGKLNYRIVTKKKIEEYLYSHASVSVTKSDSNCGFGEIHSLSYEQHIPDEVMEALLLKAECLASTRLGPLANTNEQHIPGCMLSAVYYTATTFQGRISKLLERHNWKQVGQFLNKNSNRENLVWLKVF